MRAGLLRCGRDRVQWYEQLATAAFSSLGDWHFDEYSLCFMIEFPGL